MTRRSVTKGLLFGAMAIVTAAASAVRAPAGTPKSCVALRTPAGAEVLADVARTPATRATGLAHRDTWPLDGLLLEWPTAGRHPIWMAGMRVDLDLVWLDEHARVIGVVFEAPRCTTSTCPLLEPADAAASRAVLDLPAGHARALGLTPGTVLTRLDLAPSRCVTRTRPSARRPTLEDLQ